MLQLQDVHAGYGEIEVLRGVTVTVGAREIVSIIGANGAGKSTLLRTVFGMVKPTAGGIRLGGEDIGGRDPGEVLRRGCSYVPQGRCNFPAMSVVENLEMGAYTRSDTRVRADIEALMTRFPMLGDKPTMINQMKEQIRALHRAGKTVVLVEHNMDVVMDISQRVVVLDHGEKIAEGTPEAIRRDPRVIEAYFGS